MNCLAVPRLIGNTWTYYIVCMVLSVCAHNTMNVWELAEKLGQTACLHSACACGSRGGFSLLEETAICLNGFFLTRVWFSLFKTKERKYCCFPVMLFVFLYCCLHVVVVVVLSLFFSLSFFLTRVS